MVNFLLAGGESHHQKRGGGVWTRLYIKGGRNPIWTPTVFIVGVVLFRLGT